MTLEEAAPDVSLSRLECTLIFVKKRKSFNSVINQGVATWKAEPKSTKKSEGQITENLVYKIYELYLIYDSHFWFIFDLTLI